MARSRAAVDEPLPIVRNRTAEALVISSEAAGEWERRAAGDLIKYIELMTGTRLQVARRAASSGERAIIVGQAALSANPLLRAELDGVAKRDPAVQADAIVVRRSGPHVYVVGSNDESTYFAASWLLQHWGCRWYMPTEFGQHVPRRGDLSMGALDHVYAPPFELRHYWLSWNADADGADAFRHRNFMSSATMPGAGHALDRLTSELAPTGGNHFNVPFADPRTATHVAAAVEGDYAAGRDISLAIADGNYSNDDPRDQRLITDYDHYSLRPSLTDAMLTLYNSVARILRRKHPESRSKIGGLAYANVTLPPRQVHSLESNIVMWLAPIDIDPNHAMDDPRSPPRREYREMVRRWSQVTNGRLGVYDYDQSMLVWRDLPNPSHHVFARDVKLYRAAGILGFGTESRGAFATTFLNLFFRGQLMWDPDADVRTLLSQFYVDFYGPFAEPMERYWTRIFEAWENTIVTEHEYFVVPAIYTPALVEALRCDIEEAESMADEIGSQRDSALIAERLRLTRLSFEVISDYSRMVHLAAAECEYADAARAGERALQARLALARMSPIFTTRVVGPAAETEASGPAWFPGEVQQVRRLTALVDGSRGALIKRLPLVWSFRRTEPLPPSWTYSGMEGATAPSDTRFARERASSAAGWEEARTDLYLQAQGILAEDGQSPLGHYWYRTNVTLEQPARIENARILFPGLFNEAWLFVNGKFVAHRDYHEPWWRSDYTFEWDVHLGEHLESGENIIALRGFNPHHFAGMFRRPFLYRNVAPAD